jgi:hypothetical protein
VSLSSSSSSSLPPSLPCHLSRHSSFEKLVVKSSSLPPSSPCHCRHRRRRHCRHRCRVIFLGIRHLKSLSLSHRHCRRRRRVIVVIVVVVVVIAAIVAVSSLSSLSPSPSSSPSSSCHCYGGSNIIVAILSSLCCVEAQRQRDTRRKGNNREVALPFGNPYSQQNPQFQNHPVENVLHD